MTPQHEINIAAMVEGKRVLGIVEISVIKAEQKLDPPKEIEDPGDPNKTIGVSFYGDINNPSFIFSKEIICKIDLDLLVFTGQPTANAISYVYEEIRGNIMNVTRTTGTTLADVFQYYTGSTIFDSGSTSEGYPYNSWVGESLVFTKTIAYEECSLTNIFSNVNIEEDVDDEWKEHYYHNIGENRSKLVEMEVVFSDVTDPEQVTFYLNKIHNGNKVTVSSSQLLGQILPKYNSINLRDSNFLREFS